MSLTRLALRFAAPAPKVEAFDRYLFIGPHPDDIEVGAGATAAKLVAAGKQVCFLICTDGRYGLEHALEGTTPEALIELRKAEAVASAKLLGVEDVRFLGFSDGGFYDFEDLVKAAARVVGEDDVTPAAAEQMDFFTDYEAEAAARARMDSALAREKKRLQAVLEIKKKYGKNAILRGMNFEEGSTARERNAQIGGHRA